MMCAIFSMHALFKTRVDCAAKEQSYAQRNPLLSAESKQWVERGLISEDQATRIRGLYSDQKRACPGAR